MAVTENKYQLGTAENQKFLQDVRDGLLSFGHQFPSPGGSSYYLGDDGTPWKDRNRETWITSRMTHVYSIGSMLGHEGSEALADAALKGLRGELHDDQNGGWYAGLTKDNEIVPTKQCYAHAFVILAASSGVRHRRTGHRRHHARDAFFHRRGLLLGATGAGDLLRRAVRWAVRIPDL